MQSYLEAEQYTTNRSINQSGLYEKATDLFFQCMDHKYC